MEVEKIGEEFIGGKTVNVDEMTIELCEEQLKQVKTKKEETINQINSLISQI